MMKSDEDPAYYVAWSVALTTWSDSGIMPRGRGKTIADAILDARRLCVDWYSRNTRPAGLGNQTWDNTIDTIQVWGVFPPAAGTDDPLGASRYVDVPGIVVRGIVSSLFPGVVPDHRRVLDWVQEAMRRRGIPIYQTLEQQLAAVSDDECKMCIKRALGDGVALNPALSAYKSKEA